jgi:hypothetical protein
MVVGERRGHVLPPPGRRAQPVDEDDRRARAGCHPGDAASADRRLVVDQPQNGRCLAAGPGARLRFPSSRSSWPGRDGDHASTLSGRHPGPRRSVGMSPVTCVASSVHVGVMAPVGAAAMQPPAARRGSSGLPCRGLAGSGVPPPPPAIAPGDAAPSSTSGPPPASMPSHRAPAPPGGRNRALLLSGAASGTTRRSRGSVSACLPRDLLLGPARTGAREPPRSGRPTAPSTPGIRTR